MQEELKRVIRESLRLVIVDRSNDPEDDKLSIQLLLDDEVISEAEITDPDRAG